MLIALRLIGEVNMREREEESKFYSWMTRLLHLFHHSDIFFVSGSKKHFFINLNFIKFCEIFSSIFVLFNRKKEFQREVKWIGLVYKAKGFSQYSGNGKTSD